MTSLILAAALLTQNVPGTPAAQPARPAAPRPRASQLRASATDVPKPARWAPGRGELACTKTLPGRGVPVFQSFDDAVSALKFSIEQQGKGELKLEADEHWLDGGESLRVLSVKTAKVKGLNEPFVQVSLDGETYWVGAGFLEKPKQRSTLARQAESASERERLIAKRNSKRSARVRAGMAREAAEAKAQAKAEAQARKDAKEALPYMVQMRGQNMRAAAQHEANAVQAQRNEVLRQGMTGIYYGQPAPPPRIVNMPGQPLANP